MGQQLPIFIDEVPDYEARGEFMFIRWRGLEIAMPIGICERAVARCNRALDAWHDHKDTGVVRFPTVEH